MTLKQLERKSAQLTAKKDKLTKALECLKADIASNKEAIKAAKLAGPKEKPVKAKPRKKKHDHDCCETE